MRFFAVALACVVYLASAQDATECEIAYRALPNSVDNGTYSMCVAWSDNVVAEVAGDVLNTETLADLCDRGRTSCPVMNLRDLSNLIRAAVEACANEPETPTPIQNTMAVYREAAAAKVFCTELEGSPVPVPAPATPMMSNPDDEDPPASNSTVSCGEVIFGSGILRTASVCTDEDPVLPVNCSAACSNAAANFIANVEPRHQCCFAAFRAGEQFLNETTASLCGATYMICDTVDDVVDSLIGAVVAPPDTTNPTNTVDGTLAMRPTLAVIVGAVAVITVNLL